MWQTTAFFFLAFLFFFLGALGIIMPGAGIILAVVIVGILVVRKVFTP
jgi:hypothetical protein